MKKQIVLNKLLLRAISAPKTIDARACEHGGLNKKAPKRHPFDIWRWEFFCQNTIVLQRENFKMLAFGLWNTTNNKKALQRLKQKLSMVIFKILLKATFRRTAQEHSYM